MTRPTDRPTDRAAGRAASQAAAVPVGTAGRDHLVAAVHARVARFVAAGDARAVLDPAAVSELTALLDLVAGAGDDVEALVTAGRLRWCRHLALGQDGGGQERAAALRLFARVPGHRADIPAEAARALQAAGPAAAGTPAATDATTPAAATADATAATAAATATAMATAAAAAPATATDAAGQAALAANAEAVSLLERYAGTGDQETLRRAVQATRQAAACLPGSHPDLAAHQAYLVNTLMLWFELTGEEAALTEASTVADQIPDRPAGAYPDGVEKAALLAYLRCRQYEHSGDPARLAEAVRFARACPPQPPARYPDAALIWSILGIVLLRSFERTAELADLREAVAYSRVAQQTLPQAAPPDRLPATTNITAVLLISYQRTGEVSELAEAIASARAAAEAIASAPAAAGAAPAAGQFTAPLLANLCSALRAWHRHSGDEADLAEAVEVGRQAVAAAPAGHRARPTCLHNLALALAERYEVTGEQPVLAEAIAVAEQALAALPAGHPDSFKVLVSLAGVSRLTARQLGQQVAAMDRAVDRARAAARAVPAGHHSRPGVLSALAVTLQARFIRTGDTAALHEAVGHAREAVRLTADSDPDRPARLTNLALVLHSHASRTATPAAALAELREAVAAGRAALRLAGPGRPHSADELDILADLLRGLYARTGDLATLAEAESLARQAVARTPARAFKRAGRLETLSEVLADRHLHTGAAEPIREAVELARQALAATPPDHPDRVIRLHQLGLRLSVLHLLTGQPEVLAEAVELARHAAQAVPADHPYLVRSLVAISEMLRQHYDRIGLAGGRAQDTAAAIALLRRALAITRPDDPARAKVLTELSIALRRHHEYGGGGDSVAEAVTRAQQALAGTDGRHPGRLATLGNALLQQYLDTRRPQVLDQAVHALREVVRQTPVDDPDRGQSLFNLGLALRQHAERVNRKRAMAEPVEIFREVACSAQTPPVVRVQAAVQWGLLAVMCRDWWAAARGFGLAVELLPEVAPAHLRRAHRADRLAGFAGLAADAAAVTLYGGDPQRAVELLEQGRGVLLGQALDAHTGLAELHRADPALADRLAWLRAERDPAGSPAPATPTQRSSDAQRRHALGAEWDRLVAQVRTRPGFDRFLLPPSCAQLLPHADQGPIIILNSSQIRSDALVLTTAGIHTVHLPDARPEAVRRTVQTFLDAVRAAQAPDGDQAGADRALDTVLRWLWDAVAGPVLDELGYHARPGLGQRWPRVWWAPTGLLSLLPLHAAGYHAERAAPRPPTVLDRVVSSYTPTVRALAHARRPRPAPPGAPAGAAGAAAPRLLMVSMPDTPGLPDGQLPGAAAEAQVLRGLFPGATVLTGPAATRAPVVSALRGHAWVHFACHSRTDPQGLADSHLMLYDHERQPFTVADIARLELSDAQFAFLSACDTARADLRLPDEAVHISSAFLLAGFGSVVGTLWAIDDELAVQVTRSVYTAMAHSTAADPRLAAGALHRASLRARSQHPDSPSLWAAHVHVGA